MDITDRNVDEFLSALPDAVRGDMVALDDVISAAMTGLPRELYVGKLWGGSSQEIIGYGRLSYSRADGKDVEWFMVGLAVQKNYLSLYVSAVEDGKYLSETYGKDLGKVKVGKSSISFRSVDDIDLDAVGVLVARARIVLE